MQHWLHQLALELEERLTKDREVVRKKTFGWLCNLSSRITALFIFLLLGFPDVIFSKYLLVLYWCFFLSHHMTERSSV